MLYVFMGVALLIGVYVGLGAPGMRGREDRVVHRARRLRHHTPLDWLRPPKARR
jgi:hypothetical protein